MAYDSVGSYTYPTTSDDPDKIGVLRNKFGITSHEALRAEEYREAAMRMAEITAGLGPRGNFDRNHLKALHRHIFQDVYEWAGHMRNERPTIDGLKVEPVEIMRKGPTVFLPASRLEMGLNEAFKPLADLEKLRGSTPAEFSEVAGRVLADLNYVHPFREGNGRAQQAFIAELGREYGHDVDYSVITAGRMIEASIATTRDPGLPDIKHMIEDATDPNRRMALQAAIDHIAKFGKNPHDFYICTARAGETITGKILAHDDRFASIVTGPRLVAVDRADLPADLPAAGASLTITARSGFARV